MHRRHAVLAVLVAVLASVFVWAGTAVAHEGEVVSATCSTATGSFILFEKSDHPIAFAVSVNGGPSTTVAGVESPPNFVGAGTATADISALTATLKGATGTVAVYAFWPGGSTDTATYTVTCGSPPTTTTTAPPTTTTTRPPTTPTVPIVPEATSQIVTVEPVLPPAVAIQAPPATAG